MGFRGGMNLEDRGQASSLRHTGKELRRASEEVQRLESGLIRMMNSFTLESRGRAEIDGAFRAMQQQLNELNQELESLSQFTERKADHFTEADGKGTGFDAGKIWSFTKTAGSMALDFLPIVGNAKGIIEAISGQDLITGEKLQGWERALAVLGPAGKGVRNGVKIIKMTDKALEATGAITQVTRHSDEAVDVIAATKKIEHAEEAGMGAHRAESTAETLSSEQKAASAAAKETDEVATAAAPLIGGGSASTVAAAAIMKNKGGVLEKGIEGTGVHRQISSGGLRNEIKLTNAQRSELVDYAKKLGFPEENIVFRDSWNTGMMYDRLYINTDVLPAKSPGIGTLNANSRVSGKATIAHEIVGHYDAYVNGKAFNLYDVDPATYARNFALDEAQASIRAARFAPDLTSAERMTLLRDAITRLKNGGLRIRDVKDELYIQNR